MKEMIGIVNKRLHGINCREIHSFFLGSTRTLKLTTPFKTAFNICCLSLVLLIHRRRIAGFLSECTDWRITYAFQCLVQFCFSKISRIQGCNGCDEFLSGTDVSSSPCVQETLSATLLTKSKRIAL